MSVLRVRVIPVVLASLLAGVTMGLLMAATQIQEPTLSVVPRLCAALLALGVAFPWIGAQLVRFTTVLFQAAGTVRG